MGNPFELLVPRWQEHPSGLIVPSSVSDRIVTQQEVSIPDEFTPPQAPMAVVDRRPTSSDQVFAVPSAVDLGLPVGDMADLEMLLADVPFEPAVLLLARMAAEIWHARADAERQLALVRDIGMHGLAERLERYLVGASAREERLVFSPQDINLVERLLVEHAAEKTFDDGMNEAEASWAVGAIFVAGALVRVPVEEHLMQLETGSDEWLAHFLQNGAFHSRRAPMNAFTRARTLFDELAPRFADADEYCPIDEWFEADYGLSVDEQVTAGFALYGQAGGLDESRPASGRSLIEADFFERTHLAEKRPQIEELLTADREWYRRAFADALAEAEGDVASLAWERRPFWRRPLLRCSSGQWLLVTPHALDDWLGSGFFHRALECARRREIPLQFTQFFGRLVEAYALDLVESVYPNDRSVAGGRVHGEQVYDRGQQKTSDVAVDLGPDLVLVEVVSRRLTAALLVRGDPALMHDNLERMLYAKMGQLGRVVQAIVDRRAAIPEVDVRHVERIWPVLVTAGELMQTEFLWQRIDEKMPAALTDGRVRPLTVLDLEELEVLCGLVAQGWHMPEVLGRKAEGPYARLELGRFVTEDLHLPNTVRPPIVEERWRDAGQRTRQTLGFE